MRTVKESGPAIEPDLEKTDELPVLDVVAYEAAAKDSRHLSRADVTTTSDTDRHPAIDLPALIDSVQKAEARIAQQNTEHDILERELREARARAEEAAQNAQRLIADIQGVRESAASREEMLTQALHSLGERDALITETRREQSQLTHQIDSSSKEAAQLRGDVQTLRGELEIARTELKESSASIATLQKHIERGDTALQAARRESDRLKLNATEYLERLRSREWRRHDAESSVRELDARLAGSQAEAAKFERQALELNQRVDGLSADLSQREEKIRDLETAAARDAQAGKVNASALHAAEQTLQKLSKQLADLEAARAKLQQERNELAESLKTSERSLKEERAGRKELGSKFDSAEQQRTAHSALIAKLEKSLEETQRQKVEVENQARSEHESLQTAAQRAREAHDAALRQAQESHEAAMRQMRESHETSTRQAQQALDTATLQAKESLAAAARRAQESTEADARRAHESIEAARAEASEHRARVEVLDTESAAAAAAHRARIDALDAESTAAAAALSARITQLELSLEQLQGQKTAADEEALNTQISLEDNIRRTQKSLDAATADAAEQRAKLTALDSEFAQTAARLQDVRRPVDEAEAEVQRLVAALAAKGQEIEDAHAENRKLQSSLERSRGALEEREFLIRRLERSASSNAQVLGRLQSSIERLGSTNPVNLVATASAADTPAMLVRLDGAGANTPFMLGNRTRVGRAPESDLRIESTSVSRHHAVIMSGRHTIIEDLNSTNGVLINGRKVNRQKLRDGDLLVIGEAHFRFTDGNPLLPDVNPVSFAPSERA